MIRQGREQGIRQGREQGIRQGREQGIRQGREQGREQGRALVLQQLAGRKFGPEAVGALSRLLQRRSDAESLDLITNAILECDVSDDFIARLQGT